MAGEYYPAGDWGVGHLRRRKFEVPSGVQANSFAGAGAHKMGGFGIGPVLGLSFLPMPGVAVDLVQATFDSKGRYKVQTGLEFFFDRGGTTLHAMRQKYLEPGNGSQSGGRKGANSSPEKR